jgi:hypothetical protein
MVASESNGDRQPTDCTSGRCISSAVYYAVLYEGRMFVSERVLDLTILAPE